MMSALPAPTAGSEEALNLRVVGRTEVADRIVSLTLVSADGAPLQPWQPGAHIELSLEHEGARYVRQYSLCGDPQDRLRYRIAVLDCPDGRGGSRAVLAALHPGAMVPIRGPRNHFDFNPDPARPVMFLAAGIGITPILPMVGQARSRGLTWHALHLGRAPETMAFANELAQLATEPGQVRFHHSDVDGQLDLAQLTAALAPGTQLYACGPEPLLATLENLHASVPGWDLHLERFTPLAVDTETDTAFEVVVRSSGAAYAIPAGCSILSVLREHGITAEFSCTEGVCGTCETAVLEGVPDHRDAVLSPEEQAAGDYMMICVSRAKTPRLVLDL